MSRLVIHRKYVKDDAHPKAFLSDLSAPATIMHTGSKTIYYLVGKTWHNSEELAILAFGGDANSGFYVVRKREFERYYVVLDSALNTLDLTVEK